MGEEVATSSSEWLPKWDYWDAGRTLATRPSPLRAAWEEGTETLENLIMNLIQWAKNNGAYVHKSLKLEETTFGTGKGESLDLQ